MDLGVNKTDLSRVQTFLLLVMLVIVGGCAKHEQKLQVAPAIMPEITTAYLLKHRIISYEQKNQEKVMAILPYEIKTFDESYRLYLIARIPDTNNSTMTEIRKPHYYLWIERKADNWRDFVAVRSNISPVKINAHFSSIRDGHYFKQYSIDLTLDQLSSVQDSGLNFLLFNQKNITSTIALPSLYIKAYLEMIAQASQ